MVRTVNPLGDSFKEGEETLIEKVRKELEKPEKKDIREIFQRKVSIEEQERRGRKFFEEGLSTRDLLEEMRDILRNIWDLQVLQAPGSFIASQVTITSTTVPVRLLPFGQATSVIAIVANPANSGNIFVGDSGVNSTAGSGGTGDLLDSGDGRSYTIDNALKPLHVIGDTVNDRLSFFAILPRKP